MHYTAEIRHTGETIHRLSRTQYNHFRLGPKFLWMAVSVATLAGAAYNSDNQILFYLLLFAGCWLISNSNLPAKHRAEKILETAKGDLPCSRYRFHSQNFRVTSGDYDTTLPYSKLYAIIEDSEYLYLFINRDAGYMVPKASLQPNDLPNFRKQLQEKSGLKIRKPTTFFNMNLSRLRESYRRK